MNISDISTDNLDYIKAEAERLPNGTAARFIEALDAMDGATEPMESDSDMNVKSLDSDKDVTSGLHARSKRLDRSTPDALGQRDGKQSHVVPTFVTITISREDAEEMADFFTDPSKKFLLGRFALTCQAALEAERCGDTVASDAVFAGTANTTITIPREVLYRYINYGEFAPAIYNMLAAALDEGER